MLRADNDAIEARRRLTTKVLDAVHAQGLYRCLIRASMAGDEAHPADAVQVFEEMARHDASTTWCVGQASICAMSAAYVKPAVAQEIWGRDPRGGWPGAMPRARAPGWWMAASWSPALGLRQRRPPRHLDRRPLPGRGARRLPALRPRRPAHGAHHAVPPGAGQWQDNWDVIGLRGTGSDTYRVKELFVPADYTVRRDVEEERVHPGQLYRFSTTNLYASGFAGVMMGIARRMLDEFKALASRRRPPPPRR